MAKFRIIRERLLLQFGICLAFQVSSVLSTLSVIRGNNVALPCHAYTLLLPRIVPGTEMIEWSKDDSQLAYTDRVRLDAGVDYRLVIQLAREEDQGLYTCRAGGEPADTLSTSSPLVMETTLASLTTLAARTLSEESNVTLIVEEPNPPGAPRVRVITNSSLDISWTESNGPVLQYHILYREGVVTGAPDASVLSISLPNMRMSHAITNLKVNTNYSLWVQASYVGNYNMTSPVAVYKTAPGTPTSPPVQVQAFATGATSVLVSWVGPPLTSLNGELQGYVLAFTPEKQVKVPMPTLPEREVMDLLPYTNYSVRVAAYNNLVGEAAVGPYSEEVYVMTMAAAPGIPQGLTTFRQEERSIIATWSPPLRLNGPSVSYRVYYRRSGEVAWLEGVNSITVTYYTGTGLEIYTQYDFRVTAINEVGEGNPAFLLNVSTDVAAPSRPVNVTVKDIGMGRARVSWMRPEVYYKAVDSYTVTYWESGKNVTMNAVEVDKLWRILDNLQGGVQYVVKVQAATASIDQSDPDPTGKQGEASDLVFFTIEQPGTNTTDTLGTTQSPNSTVDTQPPGANTGTIVGVVFAMAYVLALLIVGLSFLFIRMRRKDRLEFEKQENGVPPAFAKPDELEEPPISVSKFESHVIANHADSDGGFATEYEDIQRVSTSYPALSSTDPSLKHKNRYTNIVAYDHTRVKLRILPNQPLSDYINANYVDGYGRQKAYIAAQGPLKTSFEDFWRMVWEQHSMVIVMITKLEERGRRKCDRYWPAKGVPERYGEFEVSLMTKEKKASYVVRSFLLRHKHRKDINNTHGKAPERRVLQFHFTDWPDHGVPPYTLPVLSFVQKSSAANPEDAGPMVIHCSAGVGRTGTYIVIDSMLKQIQAEHKVNVFGFLKRIRTQRNYLVQTEEQYVFIHDVLLEWLKAGNTTVQAADLRQYTDRMTLPDERGKVLLDEHFKFISTQKIRDYEFAKACHALNRSKNRSKVLPIERNRVSISGVAGQESSDYINASFLQGYHRNKEFIVTQYPMRETMVEFWRMLWESNSTTIVMLTDKEEDDSPIYWPTNKDETLNFGTMKVTLCEEEHSNMSYITREFLLCCSHDDDQLTVKQYHCSYWPDSCSPLHTAFDLIYALEERSKMLALVNKDIVGPITVHDRFGGRQAGTFCSLFTLHQQLRLDNSVDVYNVVKLYANKRPGMFTTKDEYHFLYRALHNVYMAEEQIKSFRMQGLKRHDSQNNKDWHKMRYLTALPDGGGGGGLRPLAESARNSSLDSDSWYRARSQTLTSASGAPRGQRPSKFWHRRTKSEKRKPGTLSISNAGALEVTPPSDSPPSNSAVGPEVYDLAERSRDSTTTAGGQQGDGLPDGQPHSGNGSGTPSTLPDTSPLPCIHLNGLADLRPDGGRGNDDIIGRHDTGNHLEDSETIALMGPISPDVSQENAELPTDYQFAGSVRSKSRSRESLGGHSIKSEETRM